MSRASRIAAVWLALLLAAAVAGCDRGSLNGTAPLPPSTPDRTRLVGARVVHVADGDSFEARLSDGRRSGVRIGGIDAPESRQPWADRSRRHLRELIEAQPIWLDVGKTDRYGRIVAQVFVASPQDPGHASVDVGHAQIASGLAWYYRRYGDELPATWRSRYDAAERDAQRRRIGLWQEDDPMPPWEWRQQKRRRP